MRDLHSHFWLVEANFSVSLSLSVCVCVPSPTVIFFTIPVSSWTRRRLCVLFFSSSSVVFCWCMVRGRSVKEKYDVSIDLYVPCANSRGGEYFFRVNMYVRMCECVCVARFSRKHQQVDTRMVTSMQPWIKKKSEKKPIWPQFWGDERIYTHCFVHTVQHWKSNCTDYCYSRL